MENIWPVLFAIYLFSFMTCLVTINKITSKVKWIPVWISWIIIVFMPVINSMLTIIIIYRMFKTNSNEHANN